MRHVMVMRPWIDDAAARKSQPGLRSEEGMPFGCAYAQRVRAGIGQHGVENGGDIGGRDRPIGDPAGGGIDLDQRLEPEQAARSVADDLHAQAPPDQFSLDGARDRLGANGERGDVARDVDPRHAVHPCIAPSASASSMPGRNLPAGSPSSRAAGAQAHRPRQ